MNVNDPADPLLPPPSRGHHRSARERQRKGPMWGCLGRLLWTFGIGFLVFFLILGLGWFSLGTATFEGYVARKIETTLEERLGREVTIGSFQFVRTHPQKIILNDVRIANAPGAVAPHFAVVKQIEITGGVQSFWSRSVNVDRIDIREPFVWFEILPDGRHNFPQWKKSPPRRWRFQIVHLDFDKMHIRGGAFGFNDRKHNIAALAQKIDSDVTVTRAEDLYAGVMSSPLVRVRIQDYVPFDVTMRGGFRYTPGVLALQSIALQGRGIDAQISGKLDPLTEARYDLRVKSSLALDRIKEIFRVKQTLEGTLALDTQLRGKAGDFEMRGGWSSPRVVADAYTLGEARGQLNITGRDLRVRVDKATYGGGTIGADYELTKYAEPYPMKVDLRYYNVGIEPLFADWGIENTGLRGAATGELTYRWNKDKVLDGAGEGTARLAKSTVAFSDARYPVGIAGSTDFTLDRGVVRFRRAELDTDKSHVSLTGTLKIEGVVTDLRMNIRSTDLSELDQIGYNFAHAADKRDYELLGLGGAGTISGTVRGPIEKPQVAANIVATAARYNEVLLGDANIDLRYDGNASTLHFDRAVFVDGNGRLALTGNIAFPDRGPGPQFDIAAEANGYPAQRAIDAVGLELKIGEGAATGKMIIAGTPESGRATFVNTTIRRADATLALNGTLNWLPGEGNAAFDLDINAQNFPVQDIASFLDFADLPVTGKLTGTLKLGGRKEALEGAGSVTVRDGAIMGEPVELASADIAFTEGRMRATNVVVRAAAGEIRGEAQVDLNQKRFEYTIESSSIDPSRLQIAKGLSDLLGGKLVLRSTGAGTFEQPELVLEATLENATLRGLNLPAGTAPPSLYIAIRNGRLIVRGAVADIVSIEGEGSVGENMAVDGTVRVVISDLARAVAISPATATLPLSGNVVLDLKLGGRLTPIEALVVDATAPTFNVRFADHEFVAPQPLHVVLRNGRLEFESFALRGADSSFAVTGFAEITGAKRLGIDVRGRVEAALLQLFLPDARADGHMDVALAIGGTISAPAPVGTADLVDAQIKVPGFPQLIDDINGRLRFGTERIDIESLRATVGGGQVVAGGFIALEGMLPQRVRITLQGTDVSLRAYEGVTVGGNFTLLLAGDMESAQLSGDVDVTRALYFRDFDIQQTLLNILLSRTRVTPTSAATWQDRVRLRIHLAAPGTLAIRNNIAEVTGSADLDVTGTVANPVVLGEVTLDEGGTVRIQKVDYRVTRGTIAFQNPFRIDPFLDLTIEGTVSGFGSEAESGPYDVTVNLTGTLDRMMPTITSDPPASDITLFSILGFGGLGSNTGPTTAQNQGLGLMGQSLLYQSLFSYVGSKVFPFVDSFSYDPGTLDTSGGSGARVTFEKRLSNKIRFLLVYNLDNEQSRQVVEWLVNRDWTLQLTRDETDEYRLEARFRRRYDAHWRFGSEEDEGDFATSATLTTAGEAAPASAAHAPAAPLPAVTAVNTRAADDRLIARVEFRADARFDTTAMASEVTLKPGQPVTIRELQSSVKNLYATGNFRDVRVDSVPAEGGVALTFALLLNYRVDEINVEGIPRRDRTRAQRELTIRNSDVLSLDAVDDSATAVQEMLRRYGYLEATVDPETTFDRLRSVADVTLHVTPGPQAKVANVVIEGTTAPFTPAQLIERMKRSPGKVFQLGEAREDANRIKNFLVRRNYRRADVDFLGHTYDPQSNGVLLRYRVAVGPTVQVKVEGVERGAVRRWLPFARNEEYSEDAVEQAANNIVQGLQLRGHYAAAVDTESSLEDNVWTTTFHVSAGPRYRLAGVAFSGNAKLTDKDLRPVVATSPRGGIGRLVSSVFRRPTGVTREQVDDDREALESFYRLQGFSEATVAEPVVKLNDAVGTMTVEFPVTEGPQTLVAAVKVEGLDADHHPDAPKPVLVAGEPLNPQLVHDDVVALQTYYANAGHTEVQVAPRVETSADKLSATVTYAIAEGPHVDVDEVIVRGNTYTDRDVILRRSDIDPGDPFSYTRMLEAQRELYRLGIFQRVEIQPEQAGTTVSDRDVVIQVEEGKNLTLTGSVGLRLERSIDEGSGSDLQERVAVAAAHRNLFGTGRYLGLEIVASSQEQEAFLTYREPFISRWDVPLQFQIFQSDDKTRRATRIRQRGMSIEASKVARQQTRWSLRYEYKISECLQKSELCDAIGKRLPVEDFDPSLLDISISSITPTFFWDRRDDIIDPHRGFFVSASVEYAFELFEAEARFLKEYVQGAWYIPVSDRTVIALSGRLGLMQPQGGQTDGDMPISERFTAGGETTHRGYALDRLGDLCRTSPDDGYQLIQNCDATLFQSFETDEEGKIISFGPILPGGGSGLLLFNAEYRFPIFSSLGGAVFVDAGNVYRSSQIDFKNLKYGAGIGLRYLSPVGPLRIDVARPFQKRWYDDSWQYFVSLGYAF
ncbi:MAG TPA: outer membrane protein assembly factor BamA [Thermoanaerobaculia bacterium]|nr:outer membrane protein assembly factor BamA [Thermoanaerobaculia bacterium]